MYVCVAENAELLVFFLLFLHLPHRQFSFIDQCLSSKMYWTFNTVHSVNSVLAAYSAVLPPSLMVILVVQDIDIVIWFPEANKESKPSDSQRLLHEAHDLRREHLELPFMQKIKSLGRSGCRSGPFGWHFLWRSQPSCNYNVKLEFADQKYQHG